VVTSGSQFFQAPNQAANRLTRSPEEKIFRAFVISATGAGISSLPVGSAKLSVLKPLHHFSNATPGVASGYRFSRPKLSNSLFNIPLWVNREVAFGGWH